MTSTGTVDEVRGRPLASRTAPATGTVRDLRGRVARGPRRLSFRAGDIVVVSGLPGGGKTTLIKRAAPGGGIDSQDVRERWEGRMPRALPYGAYRPLVRVSHYWTLWRELRSGASLVVHDCGTQTWVRALLAASARRRGHRLHLLLLDATPQEALDGQESRGRGVSAYAFARHRAAVTRLLSAAESGHSPRGCASTTLLDRPAATALTEITFTP
ncbi:AAA family ATPase [Streptomyces sp. NPDC059708]|uniref:AAA family ATPase n=1 Tax=Streptomyces sp. NPDC059708 TaxID=3346916 RepID=UPI0036A6781B